MTVGIDASRANKSVKTGVEWYSWYVIQSLKTLTSGDGNTWILYTNEPLTGALAELPENWFEVRAHWPPKRLWTQVRLSWEMWRRSPDVLFVTGHVLPRIRPDNSVVTIHDVGFRRVPTCYKKAQISYHETSTKHLAKTKARIIVPSEFTGRELIELYGVDAARIAVTPLGIDHERYRKESPIAIREVLTKYRVSQPYFLFIGRLEAKKNIVNLVKAFQELKAHRGVGDPTKLVLVGAPGFGYDEITQAIGSSPNREDIIELGYVPEEDKPYLLGGASALVHVAWYEGFGIPPLEAMACGTPVIASQTSSLPEVIGGGNALFVPPGELLEISRAMSRILDNSELRQSLGQKGIEHAKLFTWRKTAELTLPVLTDWVGLV